MHVFMHDDFHAYAYRRQNNEIISVDYKCYKSASEHHIPCYCDELVTFIKWFILMYWYKDKVLYNVHVVSIVKNHIILWYV